MSNFMFRPAVREAVALLIGLIGCSGSGKTYSAMRLAKGICGDKPFAVIDTEAGRAKHYADLFKFDHGDLKPPFRPEVYAEAIKTADEAGYKAIIVDSSSLEWSGEGGILDWQEEELQRMAGEDYHKREACKMASWIKPKMGHKQMIQKLLQIRANLILCFRAEEKIEMKKDANGKMMIIPKGFQPICSKEMPYELTVSFLLTPDKPGIPQPIKLQEQHKSLFPLDKQINEESGKRISEWALGKKRDGEAIEAVEGTLGTEHPTPSASPEDMEKFAEESQKDCSFYHDQMVKITNIPSLRDYWQKNQVAFKKLLPEHYTLLEQLKDSIREKLLQQKDKAKGDK